VVVEVAQNGVSGFGEANPQRRYGESVESACAFLDEAGHLLGEDPFALQEIGARLAKHPGEMAAKAALDAALHDLGGKLAGLPGWKLLRPPRPRPPALWDR